MLTPLFSVSPTTLWANTQNDGNDTDSTIASLELRAYGRALAREDISNFGDVDIPDYAHLAFAVPTVTTLKNRPLDPPFFATGIRTQTRGPPTFPIA